MKKMNINKNNNEGEMKKENMNKGDD